jgi:RNA polymerase-binding transcription factor DksA
MDRSNDTFELRCPGCSWQSICGVPQMVELLQKHRLLRPHADADKAIVIELFRVSAKNLVCPQCGRMGLLARKCEPLDEEEWGMARRCVECGTGIPAERLEVFPGATLCAECQRKDERGELKKVEEYCPRCGEVMVLRRSQGTGITRWLIRCPSCGTRQ